MEIHRLSELGKDSDLEVALVGKKKSYKKQAQKSQITHKNPNYTLLVKTIAVFIYKKMLLGGDSKPLHLLFWM